MWQLFVKDLQGCTKTILIASPQHTSVGDVKRIACLHYYPHAQLLHAGRHLHDNTTLVDHPSLSHGSTLFSSLPILLGGADRGAEPCNRPNPVVDPTLPRLDDEFCMVTNESFEMNGTIVLEMPCGHPISPGGLLDYCWSELNANKTEICCLLCTREWELGVIKRYSGMSQEEFHQMEIRFGRNFCLANENIKMCSKCNSWCTRIDETNPNVVCNICTKKLGRSYRFCWHCRREWVNNTGKEACGYADCKDGEKLRDLKNSRKITLSGYSHIEMYAIRACPCCGTLHHCTDGVKRTRCNQCGTEFCFYCLRPKSQNSWFCDSKKVDCQLAPIQRKIPHMKDLQVNDNSNGAALGPPLAANPPPPPAANPPPQAPPQPAPASNSICTFQ